MNLQTENQKIVRFTDTSTSFNPFSFKDSNTLEELIFEDNVVLVDKIASFTGCKSLRKVKLPAYATSIPDRIFRDCTNLKEIIWPKVPFSVGKYAFENTAIESLERVTVKSIGEDAFKTCRTLREVNIIINNVDRPDQMCTNLASNSFSVCTSLSKVMINCITPTEIGNNCFWHCKRLKELRLLGEVWKISANQVVSTVECMDQFRFRDRFCSDLQVLEVSKVLRAFCDKQLKTFAKDFIIDGDLICPTNYFSLVENNEKIDITRESKTLWETLRELYPEEFAVKEELCFDETPEETSLF